MRNGFLLLKSDTMKMFLESFIQRRTRTLTELSNEPFSVSLALGSNEQSSLVNEAANSCSFQTLTHLAKSIHLGLYPLLLADVFQQRPAGTAMNEVFNSQTSRDSQHFWDQSKFLIIYAQVHHLSLQNPREEIIYEFFDDSKINLDCLAALFDQFSFLLPHNVVLRLNHFAGKHISFRSETQGSGEACLYAIKGLLALGHTCCIEADPKSIKKTPETYFFEAEGGKVLCIAPWLKEKLTNNPDYLNQLRKKTPLTTLHAYLSPSEKASQNLPIKVYAIDGKKCLFNQNFYKFRAMGRTYEKALIEANGPLIRWLLEKEEAEPWFQKTILMSGSRLQPKALHRTSTSSLCKEECSFLALSGLQKDLVNWGLNFEWDGLSLTDCLNGFNAGRAADMEAPVLKTPRFPLVDIFKGAEIFIVYMLAHHLASTHPKDEIQLNFFSSKKNTVEGLRIFFEKYSLFLPRSLTFKLVYYDGEQMGVGKTIIRGKGRIEHHFAPIIKNIIAGLGLLNINPPFGIAFGPELFPGYRQPVFEQELLFLGPEVEDLLEKSAIFFDFEDPELIDRPHTTESIESFFEPKEEINLNDSQNLAIDCKGLDELPFFGNNPTFFNQEASLFNHQGSEIHPQQQEDTLKITRGH